MLDPAGAPISIYLFIYFVVEHRTIAANQVSPLVPLAALLCEISNLEGPILVTKEKAFRLRKLQHNQSRTLRKLDRSCGLTSNYKYVKSKVRWMLSAFNTNHNFQIKNLN